MIEEQIRKAQIRLCYKTIPQAQFVTVVNGALLYVFLRSVIDAKILGAWLAAMLAIGALRVAAYVKFRRCHDLSESLRRWEIISLAGAVLAGLLWGGAGIGLFVTDSISHQAFLSFVIAGMTAGAVTTLSVQLPAALIFIFLANTPLAYGFAMTTHEFGVVMSFMVVLFMVMMMVASTQIFRNYRNTLAESLRRETAEKELAQIAYYDPLTGLPNRRLFAEHMRRAIASAQRHETLFAVCYLDLDNFKPFNDRYGHEVGDHVLVRAARTLQDSVRGGDVIARWGGDEFALLLTDLQDAEACVTALERLVKTLSARQNLNGICYELNASIGAALGVGENDDPDTLLRHADQAMYLAKRAGRNGYHIFDPEKDGEGRRRSETRQQLRTALDNNELILYFQPKVEMDRGVVYGAEALVRWQHPERGVLSPAAFLPLWEADESMADLDRWVLKRTVTQLDRWLNQGIRLALSVNVSAWLLNDPDFVEYVETLFVSYPRTRGLIELEVTETRALDDIARISEVMALCAPMQVKFALDDFGTGFSSLVHLQRLPAHTLKIDTSFVRAMLENDNDRNLVKGIIGLGDALGKEVVAEGVETVGHGDSLLKLGCRYAQGYGIAEPMPSAELPRWIARYVAPASWRAQAEALPQSRSTKPRDSDRVARDLPAFDL
jgi:diguanylate cyclase (GGDEF)-like protein